jgi:hypothetical protein
MLAHVHALAYGACARTYVCVCTCVRTCMCMEWGGGLSERRGHGPRRQGLALCMRLLSGVCELVQSQDCAGLRAEALGFWTVPLFGFGTSPRHRAPKSISTTVRPGARAWRNDTADFALYSAKLWHHNVQDQKPPLLGALVSPVHWNRASLLLPKSHMQAQAGTSACRADFASLVFEILTCHGSHVTLPA